MDNASSFATGIQILPIFDLVYVQNDGVSFGMFGGMPWWGLSAFYSRF
jgi:signal peptidase II